MIAVIIAGGSGTRLWPLSTIDYPKHLLKLTNEKSLLQNSVERVQDLSEDCFIVPEVSHAEHIYKQLPEISKENILVEPARRGTASCIIYALSEIKKRELKNQAIFFLWADHLIRDKRGFANAVKHSAELAETTEKLIFLGVEPTYASTSFGYMQKGKPINSAFELEQFVEKPDKSTAEKYFESGEYLWNTGYLMGTLKTFEREIKTRAPRLWNDYQALLKTAKVDKTYLDFESEAIDTALSEHVDDGIVVPGTFDWMDVGSFNDLHGVSHQDDNGNFVQGGAELENVTNSFVRNDQNLPIAVIGLDNVAIVANENGILVTNKSYAQKVGEISKKIQEKN